MASGRWRAWFTPFLVTCIFAACPVAVVSIQAPVPGILIEAKTVFLVNEGANINVFDEVAKQVDRERRLKLVDSRATADLIVTLLRAPSASSGTWAAGWGSMADVPIFVLKIEARETGEQLWQDSQRADLTQKGAVKSLVKRLHERIRMAEAQRRKADQRESRTM